MGRSIRARSFLGSLLHTLASGRAPRDVRFDFEARLRSNGIALDRFG